MIHVVLVLMVTACGLMHGAAIAGSGHFMAFHLDPAESRVWFDADARLHRFRGETQQLTGNLTLRQLVPPQLVEASVTIDAPSLNTGHPERDADMHQEFLEVHRFPTIEFRVHELLLPQSVGNPASWDLVLQGKLTVHGITRAVRVPTSVSIADERITARGQLHLDMRDYNIRVPRLFLVPMKSEVLVGFEIVAQPLR